MCLCVRGLGIITFWLITRRKVREVILAVRATVRIVIQFSSQSEVGCLTNSMATGGLDRRPAPAVIPIVLSVQYRSLEESLVCIIFLAVREPVEDRGVPWCSVVEDICAPCVQTKDLSPTAILILGMGGLRRPQVVSPEENKGDLRPGIIPDLYHHIIGVAKTRGRLICEKRRSSGRLGAWRCLGRTFLVLACFEVSTGNWITENGSRGTF